jgi:hypothetical protein
MTDHYRESDAFRASRAKTARKRYWRDPEKARQRVRDYHKRKARERGARAMNREPTVHVQSRVREDLWQQLHAAAQESGVTLSHEIRRRLEASF